MPGLRIEIIVLFAAVASPVSLASQQVRLLELGVHPPPQTQAAKAPSNFSLTAKSIGSSAMGALAGGVAGLAVDQAYCQDHHGKEPGFIFGPCFLYANEGFGVGWFGGAIVGATYGAVKQSRKRGCPRSAALLRAMAGAIVGASPGLIIVAKRTGNYPPSRSIFIASAPLLSGLGAAAAVEGCRGP
jgi:hypothetical protein